MPLQVPNLDDRTFDELVKEAVVRIPVHTPEWNNFNDSDPGMTFVQLFAFMTENLLYRSNRIPEANRKKFLTLLGVGLLPKTPGRGLVSFSNERAPIQPVAFPTGGELRAGNVPFRALTTVNILPVTSAVFYKAEQTDLDPALKSQYEQIYESFRESPDTGFQFYQTMLLEPPEIGQELPELDLADPQQSIDQSVWVALLAPKNVDPDLVRAAIARQSLSIGMYPSLYNEGKRIEPKSAEPEPVADPGLIFEIAAPDPNATETPAPARYKRLDIEYAENVLDRPGIVQVTLPKAADMTLWEYDPTEEGTGDYPPRLEDREVAGRVVTWIRIRLANKEQTDKYHQAKLAWVGVNATQVIQSVAITNELLGVANGAPSQSFQVANTPVIIERQLVPGTSAEDENFTLEVEDLPSNGGTTWTRWTRTDDLYAAEQDETVFTIDPESGAITFGDGLRGMRPPQGRRIRVSYEYGGGPEGKLAVGQLNKSSLLPGGFKVENPVPTWGASRGETTAEGERNIAAYIRHHDRLVTTEDFEDITMRTPGLDIGRVEVLPLFHPDKFSYSDPSVQFPGVVTIMVIPQQSIEVPDPPIPDRLFLDTICRWLDSRRLVTTELYVRGPVYVPVYVTIGVETMPGQVRSLVYKRVREEIREYLSPLVGGVPTSTGEGEVLGTGWELGMEVRRQDLEAVAVRVEGVRYVTGIKLGVMNAVGGIVDVAQKTMLGLQLPWLSGITVGATPDSLDAFTGVPAQPGDSLPVPVIPKKC
ncbi:MAG: putative baseplate assembly protein [Candidatus Promineifilaceae bacterium]